ncbi:MAG: tRNA pseudouridine(38-40) synthase TruA [Candidatus Dasytiphilus stammeri]
MSSTNRIALCIEYNGSKYNGWQRQPQVPSIQQCVENALSIIANQPVTTCCAGRTDAGVHSIGQVIHFNTEAVRKKSAWINGVNSVLPKDIAVRWAVFVPNNFHARFSASARYYRYIIYNNNCRPGLLTDKVMHYPTFLDKDRMYRASKYILGENNYTSFRSSGCQSSTPWRNIRNINIIRYHQYIIINIKANAFLRHMVRKIVGCLIEIGNGNQPECWLKTLLAAKKIVSYTAKPEGLYLVSVEYPCNFFLPKLDKSFLEHFLI